MLETKSRISATSRTGSESPGASGAPTEAANRAGGRLVAELAIACGGGPIQVEPGGDHRLGEVGVLGEKPVAGVHGVGPRTLGQGDELVGAQVGWPPGCPSRAKASSASRT